MLTTRLDHFLDLFQLGIGIRPLDAFGGCPRGMSGTGLARLLLLNPRDGNNSNQYFLQSTACSSVHFSFTIS